MIMSPSMSLHCEFSFLFLSPLMLFQLATIFVLGTVTAGHVREEYVNSFISLFDSAVRQEV